MKSYFINSALMILCYLIGCSYPLLATDYYVAPSGSNITGNGSIENPWQTIGFSINNIYPGDNLYLRGGVYNEQVNSVRNGTANAYITISAYNNEDAFIDGTGVGFGNGVIIDHSYLKLIGFTVRTWNSTGIWLRDCQFVELLKLKVTDVMGGIDLTGTIHDFVIDSCIIYDYYGGNGGHGIDATPGGTDSIYNGVIKNTKAYTAEAFDNCDGIGLGHDGVSNINLYNCEVFRVGDGFDISGKDIVLERCLAHDCSYGGGYKLWRDNVTLINCISYNNPTNLELDFDNATGKGVKARLINCTFFGSTTGANIFVEQSTLGSKLEMFNCILAGSNNTGLTFGDTDSANCYTGDYNLFHGYNPYRVISTSVPDFSLTQIQNGEWTAFSGQDAHSQIVFDASTLFIDTLAANPNLHLVAGTLAIDNGTNLPDAPLFDFDDCSRNVGQIDIGAHEFGACGSVGISDNDYMSNDCYELYQNFPNPFNPSTTIRYTLPKPADIQLKVYNVLGHLVRTLLDEEKPAGNYTVTWDGKDNHGDMVASGVYFYHIIADNFVAAKKLILLR